MGKNSTLEVFIFQKEIKIILIKDIFPRAIRFTFVHSPNGQSVLGALGTANDSPPQEGAFMWATNELVPYGDTVVSISGFKFMSLLKTVIAKEINVGTSA